ncbi:uncharacterized protein LOC133823577 isoform X2 [Humulus lupulus]|uniref:uncharacterized protein LOC133823577 isoform X2 n=1 Tax=Humulus lupulus TaxID=3486 RepID=UPI002B415B02|nr:uncharacterized protein LOC133823577 isoform X2 [Humulus lupulus]
MDIGYELPVGFWWRPYGNFVYKGAMLVSDEDIKAMIFDIKPRRYRLVDIFLVLPDKDYVAPAVSYYEIVTLPKCRIEELPDDAEVDVDVVVNAEGFPEGFVTDGSEENVDVDDVEEVDDAPDLVVLDSDEE